MKFKISLFFALFLTVMSLAAQEINFTVKVNTTAFSNTGGNNYQLVGTVIDDNGVWSASNIAAGDSLFYIEESIIYPFIVNSRTAAGSVVTAQITSVSTLLSSSPSQTIFGQVAVCRKNANGYCAVPSGLQNPLSWALENRFKAKLATDVTAASDVSKYTGSGIPAFTPTASDPKLAQGLASPYPLYQWNGTAWVLAGATTASNGLTATSGNVELGGTLTKPTTVTTTLSNVLKIGGLASTSNANSTGQEASSDQLMMVNGDTLKKIPAQYFLQLKDTASFAVKNNPMNQPAFTTIPPTKTAYGSANDSIAMINPSTGLITLLDKNTLSTTATSGITSTGNVVKLGGALTSATTITADATNTIAIAGLQTAAKTDSVVMVNNATGVLRKMPIDSISPKEIVTQISAPSDTMKIWKNPNLSTTGSTTDFVYKNGNWQPIGKLYFEDFGGKGDGVTLNDAAYAAAIAYTNQSEIIFQKGTYLFQNTINVPANRQIVGIGTGKTILQKNTSGDFILAGSETSPALSYGIAIRNLSAIVNNDVGSVIVGVGTANLELKDLYVQAPVTSTSKGIGIDLRGGQAANLFTNIDNVNVNHANVGLKLSNTRLGWEVTSITATNLNCGGDVGAFPSNQSKGIYITGHNGQGSTFIGGNMEGCAYGLYADSSASYVTFNGVRFEGCTKDYEFNNTLASGLSLIGCQHLTGNGTSVVPINLLANTKSNAAPDNYIGNTLYNTLSVGKTLGAGMTLDVNGQIRGTRLLASGAGDATNTVVGVGAMLSNTTGVDNTAIGQYAMESGNTGNNNTAIGSLALQLGALKYHNVAIGHLALRATSANNNIGIGKSAMPGNVTGGQNIVIGGFGFENMVSGNNNIAIGYSIGNNRVSGDNNIVICFGNSTLPTTSSNALAIGNLIYGTGIASGTTNSVGNIGIRTNTPSYALDIDAQTGGTGNPLRLKGLVSTTTADSVLVYRTVNAGVVERMSLTQAISGTTVSIIATDGSTVNIASTTTRQIINPSALIATLTINFPSSPIDGQMIRISVGSPTGVANAATAVTTTTWGNGTIYGATPTLLTGGDTIDFQYDSTNSVWRRVIL